MQREESKRIPEQIAAKQRANKTSNARRAKGHDRSTEQISAAKAANDKRAKGIERSAVQVAAAKEANDERAKGIDRSAEQVAAAKAANSDRERAQGSDRSSKQVSTVKEANKKYYAARPSKHEVEEREQFERWASYKRQSRTRFERLFDDAEETLGKHDYRGALLLFKEARTLIPKPGKYVRLNLVQYYCMVHSYLGSILYELGDMHGAIESLNEALRMAAFKNATEHPDGQLTQDSLSSILRYKVNGIRCVRRLL